jgi:hypothetical protein
MKMGAIQIDMIWVALLEMLLDKKLLELCWWLVLKPIRLHLFSFRTEIID